MKTAISLSGGLDSAVLLSHILDQGDIVEAVSFRYGSTHNLFELDSASALAHELRVPHRVIDMRAAFHNFRSALMGNGPIPKGHYEDATMSQTVVPARNIIFASIMAGIAWSTNCNRVVLAVHSGDHAIYPDCRPEFINTMATAIRLGTDGKVELDAPFINMNKASIVNLGARLKTPFHLTRTCYETTADACGCCGSCVERLEAFESCGLKDPVRYQNIG